MTESSARKSALPSGGGALTAASRARFGAAAEPAPASCCGERKREAEQETRSARIAASRASSVAAEDASHAAGDKRCSSAARSVKPGTKRDRTSARTRQLPKLSGGASVGGAEGAAAAAPAGGWSMPSTGEAARSVQRRWRIPASAGSSSRSGISLATIRSPFIKLPRAAPPREPAPLGSLRRQSSRTSRPSSAASRPWLHARQQRISRAEREPPLSADVDPRPASQLRVCASSTMPSIVFIDAATSSRRASLIT
mmetsp:Transcript_39017/g.126135  ORF Transcript_39017/g.126135 Transcript_39017/m.126135 type:complete len:255 (-) Transcript_39017:126-890(-)